MMITNAEEFVRLRTSEDPTEYRRAAEEQAPLSVWLDVIDRYPEMRSWVAHNRTVPTPVLERLAEDDDPQVRSTVALRRKTTAAILTRLADDTDAAVRLHVARHRNTPRSVLEHLAEDSWAQVRSAAIANLDR